MQICEQPASGYVLMDCTVREEAVLPCAAQGINPSLPLVPLIVSRQNEANVTMINLQ